MKNKLLKLYTPIFVKAPMKLPKKGELAPYWSWGHNSEGASTEVDLSDKQLALKGDWASEEQKSYWLKHFPGQKNVSLFEKSGWLPIVKMAQNTVWVKMNEEIISINALNTGIGKEPLLF